MYILFNNVSYFGWSLTNHWPRALFPIKHDCRGLNCHFNLLTDILCELRYHRWCFIEKWPKYSIIIRYATLLQRIGYNREGSEQSMNVDRKSLEFSICRQLQSKKSVSDGIWSTFVDSINVFDNPYPVCVLIQWIRNQNNLKQELGVIYIFQSCFCWKKKRLFPHRIVSNRKHS